MSLWRKTRCEVYPICTHNILLTPKLYDFTNDSVIKFIEKSIIGTISLADQITFWDLDLNDIENLIEMFQNMAWKSNLKVTRLDFVSLQILENHDKYKNNSYSNLQELVWELNNKWKITHLNFDKSSASVWSWILTFLDLEYLTSIRFSNVSLSFIKQIEVVFKEAHNLKEIEFNWWKLIENSKMEDFRTLLAKVIPKLTSFKLININFNEFMCNVLIYGPVKKLLDTKPISKHSSISTNEFFDVMWDFNDEFSDIIGTSHKSVIESVVIKDSEYLNLTEFVVWDKKITMSYFENVYIDMLRIWNPNKLKVLHIECGDFINFSKYSFTISQFFEAFEKFKWLEDLKLKHFDLDENSLIEMYVDTLRNCKKLKVLNLSNNLINDDLIMSILLGESTDPLLWSVDMYSKHAYFPKLETLDISFNNISLSKLSKITAKRCKISPWLRNMIWRPQKFELNPYKLLQSKMRKEINVMKKQSKIDF